MKNVLKQLGIVLFVSILLIKLSAFHIYEHHDTIDEQEMQCELCFLVFESQHSEGLQPIIPIIEDSTLRLSSESKIIELNFQPVPNLHRAALFSRPPPS